MGSRILLVDDESCFFDAVKTTMSGTNVEITWEENGASAIQKFKQNPHGFAMAVLDYKLKDLTGPDVAYALRKINPKLQIVFVSGYKDESFLLDQLKFGSAGFYLKGEWPTSQLRERILSCVDRFQKEFRLVGLDDYEITKAEAELALAGFAGRDEKSYAQLKEIEKARTSPFPTMLIGETGTGKDHVARAMIPKGKNLININCAQFASSENLMESILFGYKKGAYTGAEKDTAGLILQAHNHVLFLDELHHLTLSAQAKLLRFLQDMKFRPVGDTSPQETSVDFKLITAVQSDFRERIKDGRFLPDLAERVSALIIEIAPLRERPDDIEPLARKFMTEHNKNVSENRRKYLSGDTMYEMTKLPWPTNVRGLQNAIKRMYTNSKESGITPLDLKQCMQSDLMGTGSDFGVEAKSFPDAKKKFESNFIIETLKKCRTQAEAAFKMDMSPPTMMRKLEALGINAKLYLK